MARVIVDGPGRSYLQQHCRDTKLTICNYLPHIPNDANEFLWDLNGIWQTASPATRERLRQEEVPFVLATLRTYPREELLISATNFWHQLISFDLGDYGPNRWVLDVFEKVLPGARAHYLVTRQAQDALPDDFSTSAQNWAVLISLLLIGTLMPLIWRHRKPRLVSLTAVIVFMVIANALVTGVLSGVEDRYQSRVIWLMPLLAGLFVLEWLDHRTRRDCKKKAELEESVCTNLSDV
jgi:hypothetical protein